MEDKKLNKEELIVLVQRVMDGDFDSEKERDDVIALIECNIPAPGVTNYIFYSKPALTAEEVVEKALAYKPILL